MYMVIRGKAPVIMSKTDSLMVVYMVHMIEGFCFDFSLYLMPERKLAYDV